MRNSFPYLSVQSTFHITGCAWMGTDLVTSNLTEVHADLCAAGARENRLPVG